MAQSNNLNVIDWMKQNNCYDEFRKEMNRSAQCWYVESVNYYNHFYGTIYTISEAFDFSRTLKGKTYWKQINEKFQNWYCKNNINIKTDTQWHAEK